MASQRTGLALKMLGWPLHPKLRGGYIVPGIPSNSVMTYFPQAIRDMAWPPPLLIATEAKTPASPGAI